jgi:hypothetical protein
MPCSLIQENNIVIPVSLAATLGLEEATLLQVLASCLHHGDTKPNNGYDWLEIPNTRLLNLMPFWDLGKIDSVSRNLEAQGIIRLNNAQLNIAQALVFALNEQSEQVAEPKPLPSFTVPPISNQWNNTPPPASKTIGDSWQPGEQTLLTLSKHHGVDRGFALAQVDEFKIYWRDRGASTYSWDSKFLKHAAMEWRKQQARPAQKGFIPTTVKDTALDEHWIPSIDAMQILTRSGIAVEFIEDAIPEFVLYWRERGDELKTWNSKFIAHIRRQWGRYALSLQADTEPQRMTATWQPSIDVFDIIEMATIEREFALQQVPEFVLFWRESNQIHTAWNSKFLQHVKHQWARRHQYDPSTYDQKTPQSATGSDRRGFVEKHTDSGWAEDL